VLMPSPCVHSPDVGSTCCAPSSVSTRATCLVSSSTVRRSPSKSRRVLISLRPARSNRFAGDTSGASSSTLAASTKVAVPHLFTVEQERKSNRLHLAPNFCRRSCPHPCELLNYSVR
jgi:hypothetical protein